MQQSTSIQFREVPSHAVKMNGQQDWTTASQNNYGGPFTTEQAEDVKTVLRILVVISVITMPGLPFTAHSESAPAFEECFGSTIPNSIPKVLHNVFRPSSFIMYSIPLHELLIYPCLRNRGPSILQSAGIGAAALIASSLYGTTAEAMQLIGHNECMFMESDHNASNIGILIGIPFNCILGFTAVVLTRSSLEFVCAQTPHNMKGLLIGLLFTLYVVTGTLVFSAWSKIWFAILGTSTCGIWFYLSTLVLAVVSSALLGLVIRWYKARER